MRTTIEFDDDTAKAVEALRKRSGLGVSDATNELIRRGMLAPTPDTTFRPRSRQLGLRIDVSNVAEALDVLEGPTAR
jgi:hypothetical protein